MCGTVPLMASSDLACAYVVTLDEPHRTRAALSLATLRRHDPELRVVVLVPGPVSRGAAAPLRDLAAEVREVAPLHAASGYFQDNRRHLADLDADRIVYLDADTLVFGSVRALAARHAHADVAARPSPWVWWRGYERRLAPDVVAPLNGGVLALSREFCASWAQDLPARHAGLLRDPGRRALVAWLRGVTPHAYHRDEFVLAAEAWSGAWRVATLGPEDCHLLERWPAQEDPATWLRATVLHTYSGQWEACVERLRAVVDLPYARAVADEAALDRRFDQRWVDWVVEQLLARRGAATVVDVMVRRDFPRAYAERRVGALARSPVLAAAARAYRPKAKAASFLGVLAELERRSGFRLERRALSAEDFYRDHVFTNRPVILPGLMRDWPALEEWTPERLKERYGHVEVEISRGREGDARYEDNFADHRETMPFGAYIDLVVAGGPTNDHYMVARNEVLDRSELAGLRDDFVLPSGFLDPAGTDGRYVRLWFGPAGTVTPLHCDNRNVLFAQVQGRKHVRLIAPQFLSALANDRACYSAVDLDAVDYERFPAMRDVPVHEAVVEPGEFLFIPIGWWHAVRSLDVSMSLSFTNLCFNEPEIGWREASL